MPARGRRRRAHRPVGEHRDAAAALGAASSSSFTPPRAAFDAALAANLQMQAFCRTQLEVIDRALAAHARPSAVPQYDPALPRCAWSDEPLKPYFYDESHPVRPTPLPNVDARRRAELDRVVPMGPEKGKEGRPWTLKACAFASCT